MRLAPNDAFDVYSTHTNRCNQHSDRSVIAVMAEHHLTSTVSQDLVWEITRMSN